MGTLIRYLLGDRKAILALATSRRTLSLGFLLVLSAGVAREYDSGNPLWHMLVPAAVSVAASYLLFMIAFSGLERAAARAGGARPPMPPLTHAYRVFLGLFWMTAPLAWLYAVPYERFLTPAGAMRANLLTLGVVSVWRVVLMVRVLEVVMGYRAVHAFAVVMAFADIVVLVAMFFVPVPLVEFMSGAERTASDRVLQSVAGAVCTVGVLSLPVWLIAAGIALRRGAPGWWLPPP